MIEVLAIALVAAVVLAAIVLARRLAARSQPARVLDTPSAVSTTGAPVSPALAFLRRHPWARRSMSLVSVALLLGAAGMLGYPFYTNLYQSRVQQRLDNQLTSPELEQAYRAGRVGTGDALTRIRIPAINVDVVVVEGVTSSALRAGAGHYPTTPLPCELGNVGIAGHRTTYGRPFANLDRLQAGDEVILETPVGACTYTVSEAPYIVAPHDTGVVGPTPGSVLTLTTCHPKGSAAKRLIIRAELQGPAASA